MGRVRSAASALGEHASTLFALVALAWALELFDLVVLGGSLDALGIRPRDPDGLWGILLAPLLHGSLAHLAANTVPFVVLGWLVMLRRGGTAVFFAVLLVTMLLGGLGTWLFGRPGTVHIGASLVVFGLLGYLLLRGYFERSFTAILVALVAGALYGGALWGVLPGRPGTSWEGHLFGFLGGAASARVLSSPTRRRA